MRVYASIEGMGRESLTRGPVGAAVVADLNVALGGSGMSRRALARAAGLKETRLRDVLANGRPMLIDELNVVAEALGLVGWEVMRDAEAAVAARERGVAVSVSSDGDSAASSSNGDAGGLPPEWELAASRGRDSRAEVVERLGFCDDLGEESQVSPEED